MLGLPNGRIPSLEMMYGIGQLQNPYYKEVLRKIIN